MVSYCYVCKKCSKSEPKTFMFKPNKDNLQEWHQILGKKERPLKISHKICENHFKEDDIIRHDKFLIKGKEVLLPKVIPILKPGAVPCIFNQDNDRQPYYEMDAFNDMLSSDSNELPMLSYDELVSQMTDIFVPSDEWALHKNGNIVSFVHVSYNSLEESIIADKIILFKGTSTPVCFFNDIKSDLNITCTTTDAVSELLKYIDSVQMCEGDSNCRNIIYVNNSVYCSSCEDKVQTEDFKQSEQVIKKKVIRTSKGSVVSKLKKK